VSDITGLLARRSRRASSSAAACRSMKIGARGIPNASGDGAGADCRSKSRYSNARTRWRFTRPMVVQYEGPLPRRIWCGREVTSRYRWRMVAGVGGGWTRDRQCRSEKVDGGRYNHHASDAGLCHGVVESRLGPSQGLADTGNDLAFGGHWFLTDLRIDDRPPKRGGNPAPAAPTSRKSQGFAGPGRGHARLEQARKAAMPSKIEGAAKASAMRRGTRYG